MKRLYLVILCVLLSIAAPVEAQFRPVTSSPEPLGIGLEGVPYPFPVKFLPLEIEGQSVRMAFMDVMPGQTHVPIVWLRDIPITAGFTMQSRPNGRTVLLLHGKNFYGSYWQNTIYALANEGYRVIVPDQIGFGKSSKPDINYSFDLLAENTKKLLDALGVQQVAVVGHSMGGMLAVRFARTFPERVTHLVLENPIGLEDYRLKIPPQSLETLYQNELNDTDPAKIRAFYARYFAQPRPELYESFVQVKARLAQSGEFPRFAKASASTYQMIYQQPVRHEFGLIAAPTLLVIGQADRTVVGRQYASEEIAQTMGQYPELSRAAARDIPHAKVVELPGVGHIPHLEAPGQFHTALLEFLKGTGEAK